MLPQLTYHIVRPRKGFFHIRKGTPYIFEGVEQVRGARGEQFNRLAVNGRKMNDRFVNGSEKDLKRGLQILVTDFEAPRTRLELAIAHQLVHHNFGVSASGVAVRKFQALPIGDFFAAGLQDEIEQGHRSLQHAEIRLDASLPRSSSAPGLFRGTPALLARRNVVKPHNSISDDVELSLELLRAVRPGRGEARLAFALCLVLELARERATLCHGPQGAAQRTPQVIVESQGHQIGGISMTDVAAVPDEVTFIDFPHGAVTIGTSKAGTFSDPIHLLDSRMGAPRNGDLKSDAWRNWHGFTRRLRHQPP